MLNDAAFDYLDQRYGTDPTVVTGLRTRTPQHFCNEVPFLHHLASRGIDIFDREKIRPLDEAGIWGAIRHYGLIGNAVIVSDDAGQFRIGTHALCWVHWERLLQKLMPATPGQVKQVETVRDLIWRFYKALKAYRQRPDARLAIGLDTLLGLMKTCQKLGLSFWHYLGDRLGIDGQDTIPPLATLIAARA